jgi:hypothetical protein
MLRVMAVRAFGAGSPREFWYRWNPAYSYALTYWCYRPLRRFLPPGLAALITFAVSGFALHDLLFWPFAIAETGHPPRPVVTLAFVLAAAVLLSTQRAAIDVSRWPLAARATFHLGWLLACFAVAVTLPWPE